MDHSILLPASKRWVLVKPISWTDIVCYCSTIVQDKRGSEHYWLPTPSVIHAIATSEMPISNPRVTAACLHREQLRWAGTWQTGGQEDTTCKIVHTYQKKKRACTEVDGRSPWRKEGVLQKGCWGSEKAHDIQKADEYRWSENCCCLCHWLPKSSYLSLPPDSLILGW